MMQVKDKKILVVGMARSGIAAAKLLAARGAVPILNDSKEISAFGDALDELKALPCVWRFGCPAMDVLSEAEGVVISPVVPDTAPFVVKAREMGLPVIGELELAYELALGDMVAVTGTNGKTTTVSLLGEMFKNAGKVTHVVGNIGYPYSAAAIDSRQNGCVCDGGQQLSAGDHRGFPSPGGGAAEHHRGSPEPSRHHGGIYPRKNAYLRKPDRTGCGGVQ